MVVVLMAALDWVGWLTGVAEFTGAYGNWPPMTPWTALWLAGLAAAILVQTGQPSGARLVIGRVTAGLVAAGALVVLAEYAGGWSAGLDLVWFEDAVRTFPGTWPGRPNMQSAAAVLLVSAGVALMRLDRRWVRLAWPACLAGGAAISLAALAVYLFEVMAQMDVTPATGMAVSTAVAVPLLVVALAALCPDRVPMTWLLARPDRRTLVSFAGLAIGFPILVALARLAFLALGRSEGLAFTLAVLVCTVIAALVVLNLHHQEQSRLIEKAHLDRQRADAEMRYHILADNAVDVIVHLRDSQIAWVSPSVEGAFGAPPEHWIGSEFSNHIHPDDLDTVVTAVRRIATGDSVIERYRVRGIHGDYHWVEGHGKPYVNPDGNTDGLITALRIIDNQIEAEQRLDRLARYDTLTGLPNRAEVLGTLEAANERLRSPGPHLAVLFCDIDNFKDINDTWGHHVGDAVLATMATRIRDSVRQGDTVGRIGGDELLILLVGIHSLDEAVQIAEKIRSQAAEPIHQSGHTLSTTLSIGVTLAVPGEPVTSIVTRADAAMYQAKTAGRNNVVPIEPTQQLQPRS